MPKIEHSDRFFLSSLASRRTFLKAGGAAALAATGFATSARADASRPLVYAYANWSDVLGVTFVGIKLIEDHFGYKVQPLQADVAVVYASLQSGKADVFSAGYLEGMGALKGEYRGGHADYVNKIADSIEAIGIGEGPLTQGLAVPEYVDIDSIEDLNANADKFSNSIIGIDPGSGLMQAADKTVEAYDLKLKLVGGSEGAMGAAFQRAYSRQEWIVVATWTPLPMWSQFKMKYLKDPKKTMMQEEFNNFHLVRKDFKENFPKAYEFFKKFHVPNDDLALIMSEIDGGKTPQDAAAKWIDANQDKVKEWIA